jgi:hypothetical protein
VARMTAEGRHELPVSDPVCYLFLPGASKD